MPPLPLVVHVGIKCDGHKDRKQEGVRVGVKDAHLGESAEEGAGGQAGVLEVGGVVEGVGLVEVVGWVEQVLGQVELEGVVLEEPLEDAIL